MKSVWLTICLAVCMSVPIFSFSAAPARADDMPSFEDLNPTATYTSLTATTGMSGQVLGNRTEYIWQSPYYAAWEGDTYNWWDYDPGFWYVAANDSDDETTTPCFGTHNTKVTLSNPTTEWDYYTVRMFVRAGIWDGWPCADDYRLEWLYADTTATITIGVGYLRDGVPTHVYYPEGDYSQIQRPNIFGTYPDFQHMGHGINTQDTDSAIFPKISGATEYYNDGVHGTALISTQTLTYYDFTENPAYGRPWTYDEVCSMYGLCLMQFSQTFFSWVAYQTGEVRFGLAQLYAVAIPVVYEPEETPEGSFVLRPDADRDSIEGWTNVSSGIENDLWACTDESTYYSDQDTTYIFHDPALGNEDWLGFTFSDPPSWAANVSYNVTLWIMLRTSDLTYTTFEEPDFITWLGSAPDDPTRVYGDYIYSYWFNWTEDSYTFTLEELDIVRLGFQSEILSGACLNISQIGLLCEPSVAVDIDWPSVDSNSVFAFLQSGGIPTLFGVMGFFGMIAVPAIGVLRFRAGEGGYSSVLQSVSLMVLFLGFFMIGILA